MQQVLREEAAGVETGPGFSGSPGGPAGDPRLLGGVHSVADPRPDQLWSSPAGLVHRRTRGIITRLF